MAKQFQFWLRCIHHTWRGCWTRANELASLLGGGLLTAVLWACSPYLSERGWVEAPTSFLGVTALATASALASIVLAFIVIFFTRFALAPAQVYSEQRELADGLQRDLERIQSGWRSSAEPNWTIRDVFFYLEPNALDEPKKALWEQASVRIRDAATLGRLKVWGRPFKTKLGEWVGERAALREIESSYWRTAYFTYLFFDDASGVAAAHCYADRDQGVPSYTDLQVNREQALALWPEEPGDIADSYPNVRVADTPAIIALFEGSGRAKLIALLASGKIASWARLSHRKPHDLMKLGGDIWNSHTFLFLPKGDQKGMINQTFLQAQNYSSHYDVCMNYAQLTRVWPDLHISRTNCEAGR
jgi:hypothetical protein